MKSIRKHQGGYVALISVLILGAIATAITLSILLTGVNSSQVSQKKQEAEQAKGLANLCAEDALQTIRSDPAFIGTQNINISGGACNYTVIDLGVQSREIEVSGTYNQVTRKLVITLDDINPQINITSWQEVADF